MSTFTSTTELKISLRDFDSGNQLDTDYQRALDAAEAATDAFVGFDVAAEFGSGASVPAPIAAAAYILARLECDAHEPATEQQMRARAESLLRPYRRETGIAGGAQ